MITDTHITYPYIHVDRNITISRFVAAEVTQWPIIATFCSLVLAPSRARVNRNAEQKSG